eukprot:6417588-Pyramimonas_sp.AAC.1
MSLECGRPPSACGRPGTSGRWSRRPVPSESILSPAMTRSTLSATTANANSHGALRKYLAGCDSDVVVAQEHRAELDKLPEILTHVLDA